MDVPFNLLFIKCMANKDIQHYWIGGIGFILLFIIGLCIAPLVTLSIVWLAIILLSYVKWTYFMPLCWKTSSEIAPTITLFRNFALDLEPKSWLVESDIITKGVIEIIFLVQISQVWYSTEMIGNSTCTDCIYPAVIGGIYSEIGVGLLFYLWKRQCESLN